MWINTQQQTSLAVGINLGTSGKVAAIDQMYPAGFTLHFGGFRAYQPNKWLLMGAAGTTLTVENIDTRVKWLTVPLALAGPGSRKLDLLPTGIR
ncbi:hypothetical protein D3C81_1971560 [compost metagenome]